MVTRFVRRDSGEERGRVSGASKRGWKFSYPPWGRLEEASFGAECSWTEGTWGLRLCYRYRFVRRENGEE
jgi:hypothetical protein